MPDSPVHTTKSRRIHIVPRSWGRVELLALTLALRFRTSTTFPLPPLSLSSSPPPYLRCVAAMSFASTSPSACSFLFPSFSSSLFSASLVSFLLAYSTTMSLSMSCLMTESRKCSSRSFQFPIPPLHISRSISFSHSVTNQEKCLATWLNFLLLLTRFSATSSISACILVLRHQTQRRRPMPIPSSPIVVFLSDLDLCFSESFPRLSHLRTISYCGIAKILAHTHICYTRDEQPAARHTFSCGPLKILHFDF